VQSKNGGGAAEVRGVIVSATLILRGLDWTGEFQEATPTAYPSLAAHPRYSPSSIDNWHG
jgi:hypothetical protein